MNTLILDDEQNIRKILRIVLAEYTDDIHEASTIELARELIQNNRFDVALVDLRLPDGSGIDILRLLKEQSADTIVLIVTAFSSTDTAVEAMKLGAYDYITKPFNVDELKIILKNVHERVSLGHRLKQLEHYADSYQFMIGKSEAMRKVFLMIDKISPFDTNVLIIGETGTGKELVAKAIHDQSRRASQQFVAINCASLPAELLESELFGYTKGAFTGAYTSKRGLIEIAHKGTLFLDEIGEMPPSLQAKLLRFLEDKKIRPVGSTTETETDVRVISATNRMLSELSERGDFRSDLYYRLSTFIIDLPSLKERREDIPLLIDHFVKLISKKFDKVITKIDNSFIQYVLSQDLKGNVRELKNIIEREIVLSEDGVLQSHAPRPQADTSIILSELLKEGFNLEAYLQGIERDLLFRALEKTNGVKTKAADVLGISFREFRYRLSKYSKK